eukprot:Sdes_comp10337_c0_seq1m1982
MEEKKKGQSIFVTVGTTKFDQLIRIVCSEEFRKESFRKGYDRILIQLGNSFIETNDSVKSPEEMQKIFQNGFPATLEMAQVNFYRFKPTLKADMMEAQVVISHCGAGSCLEVLESEGDCYLLVVVNEKLMDNHQLELAEHLHEEGFCGMISCCDLNLLKEALPDFHDSSFFQSLQVKKKKFLLTKNQIFPHFLNFLFRSI